MREINSLKSKISYKMEERPPSRGGSRGPQTGPLPSRSGPVSQVGPEVGNDGLDPQKDSPISDTPYNDGIAGMGKTRGESFDAPPTPPQWHWKYNFLGNAWEAKWAQYQNDLDWWRWNQQNEWNTPANQMARYMDAGLNPNLMYGQGNPGNAEGTPKSNRAEIQHGKGREIVKVISGAIQTGANIKNLGSVTRLNNIKAITEAARKGLIGKQTAKTEAESEIISRSADAVVQKRQLEVEAIKLQNQMTPVQISKMNKEMDVIEKTAKYQQWVNELAEAGLTTTDPYYIRVLYWNTYQALKDKKSQKPKKPVEKKGRSAPGARFLEGKENQGWMTVPDDWYN